LPAGTRTVGLLQGTSAHTRKPPANQPQREEGCGRSWIKQSRIEARLRPDGRRPARIRLSTPCHLREQLDACEKIRDQWLVAVAARAFPGLC
jgi:hypothetical protein